jgi:uncharacterized membrane protein YedE/YeeE
VKQKLVTFFAGVVFAVGLGISGMTNPAKVIGFLDVTGTWDPSLALVMGGAIGVHLLFAQWSKKAERPLWADAFVLPKRADVDGRLIGGAALFGLGWGTAGYCPGPALVSLVGLTTSALVFCASMVAGVAAFHVFAAARREGVEDGDSTTT